MAEEKPVKEKSSIKILRDRCGGMSEAMKEQFKNQTKIRREITAALKQGAKTVPELAKEIGYPSEDVMWHLMAMKKYGLAVEVDEAGDYYRYGLKGA